MRTTESIKERTWCAGLSHDDSVVMVHHLRIGFALLQLKRKENIPLSNHMRIRTLRAWKSAVMLRGSVMYRRAIILWSSWKVWSLIWKACIWIWKVFGLISNDIRLNWRWYHGAPPYHQQPACMRKMLASCLVISLLEKCWRAAVHVWHLKAMIFYCGHRAETLQKTIADDKKLSEPLGGKKIHVEVPWSLHLHSTRTSCLSEEYSKMLDGWWKNIAEGQGSA